eukprot:COSAG04_NODE_20600_length_390_cov_0.890034_1_plen_20_part_10
MGLTGPIDLGIVRRDVRFAL